MWVCPIIKLTQGILISRVQPLRRRKQRECLPPFLHLGTMLLNLWYTTYKSQDSIKKIGIITWKIEIICFKCNSPYQPNVNYQDSLRVLLANHQLKMEIILHLIDFVAGTMVYRPQKSNWIIMKIRCRVYIKRAPGKTWTMICNKNKRTIPCLHQNKSSREWANSSTHLWMNWRIRLNISKYNNLKCVTHRLKVSQKAKYRRTTNHWDLAQVTISIGSLWTFLLFPRLTLRRKRVILSI